MSLAWKGSSARGLQVGESAKRLVGRVGGANEVRSFLEKSTGDDLENSFLLRNLNLAVLWVCMPVMSANK